MKKTLRTLILVLALVICCTVTCVANAEMISDENFFFRCQTTNNNVFLPIPDDGEEVTEYRREVKHRLENEEETGYFLTRAETEFLEKCGYDVRYSGQTVQLYDEEYGILIRCEYPVVYQSSNGIELWYTTRDGDLYGKAVVGKTRNGFNGETYGQTHYDKSVNEVVLISARCCSVLYDSLTGVVTGWEFGEVTHTLQVPMHSVYAGFSEYEGFIFRDGTDVYAVRDYNAYFIENHVSLIARNVKMVITASYSPDGSDEWSNPLFLMMDGSIQMYCPWYGDDGAPADDESNLVTIKFEGGFNV